MQIWNAQSFRSKDSTVYYLPEFHQTQRSWDASPVRLGMLVPCFLPSVSWESDVFSCGSYSCAAVLWDQQYWRLKVMRTLGATKGGHLSTAATHLLLKWAAKVHSCCNTRRQTLKASESFSVGFSSFSALIHSVCHWFYFLTTAVHLQIPHLTCWGILQQQLDFSLAASCRFGFDKFK